MTKSILVAGGLPWSSPIHVGNHHIAQGFADLGWRVCFLSDPISPFHLLNVVNQELRERWAVYKEGGKWEYDHKIWGYVPGALLTPHNKPILRSKWVMNNWSKLTIPSVRNKIKEMGFADVDILYLANSNDVYLLDCVRYKKSIMRIADMNCGFPKSTRASRAAEEAIARRADMVLYTAKNLEEYVLSLSPKKAVYFPNGVDYQHFASGSTEMPEEYKNLHKPIALYVGAMGNWFDFDLVSSTAHNLPEISFVLIGPDEVARKRLRALPNLHILGPRKFSELPAYMHNADVGLIPFDVKNHPDLINSTNPLKLYEYMACGLPVVTIAWKELTRFENPAILCSSQSEFESAIVDACSQGKTDKEKFQAFAQQHDWASQIQTII